MNNRETRRGFMKAAGMAAAGIALGQALPARAADTAGRFKKAVGWQMIGGDMPVIEKFQMLKELGFHGVEPRVKDIASPDEMLKASRETGIEIHGVVNGSVENINAAVDTARQVGATSVLLVAGRVNEKMPYEENYKKTQAVIAEAAPYAEQHQVYLLVENVWNNFLLSPLEMRQYLDEIGSPWVAAYFDAGNVARYGWPEHWIPVLGERIKRLHIKEFSRKKMDDEGTWKGFNVEIGDGEIDWAAVCAELAKIGYEGWVTAEVNGGDRARLADISARMDRVLSL